MKVTPCLTDTPEQDEVLIRSTLTELLHHAPDNVEGVNLEIKGWCKDTKDLFEKMGDSSSCLANGDGGLVLLGVKETSDPNDRFSHCPWKNIDTQLLALKLSELTHPPVVGRVYDASSTLRCLTGSADVNVFAIVVPKSTSINGHMTTKGVSKVRVGKECRPNFTAEDDYTKRVVPGLSMEDLSVSSLNWALIAHEKTYKVPRGIWECHEAFLLQTGLIWQHSNTSGKEVRHAITMAALLLFGTEKALSQHLRYCETVLKTRSGTKPMRKNIVESYRELCETKSSLIPAMCPNIGLTTLKELVMNSYIHRCYRVPSGIVITADENEFTIQNPGELAASLKPTALIYCVPVYRNLLLAEGCRFLGLCDKVGLGIDQVYQAVLSEGFDFPHFASEDGSFLASVPLSGSANFREFVKKRSQALTSLDEIAVLRTLYSNGDCSFEELVSCMQRGADRAKKVLNEMAGKQMTCLSNGRFALCAPLRTDIDQIFSSDQLLLEMDLYGDR